MSKTSSRVFGLAAVGRRIDDLHRERHDFVLESPAVDGGDRALVAAQRERILLFARDRRLRARGFRRPARCSDRRPGRWRPASGFGDTLFPPIGTMLIDSVPPPMTTCACPSMMRSAPYAIACSPDEQKRLTVTADASIGTPARRLAMRATLRPCSPSGIAQPENHVVDRCG